MNALLLSEILLVILSTTELLSQRQDPASTMKGLKKFEPCMGTYRKEKVIYGEPSVRTIKEFDEAHSIPLLEVDPALIDTTKYTDWYRFWTRVPTGNAGIPPPVGDLDHNRRAEMYGTFQCCGGIVQSLVYDVDSIGGSRLIFEYIPRRGSAIQITDVDSNGMQEIAYQLGDSMFFYEQHSPDSVPMYRKFAHAMFEYPGSAYLSLMKIAELDGDEFPDFVYMGTLPDTITSYHIYTCVAEYDSSIHNFRKVWKTQLFPPDGESAVGGYDVGDYDGDGKMEFLASSLYGKFWVVENMGDDNYAITFQDSLPFVNMVYQTSGDVDGDGKREFFVSATMGSGNWITTYETDGDNHFVPTFQFRLLSGGSLDEPTLMTRDLNGDGKPELIVTSGGYLYVFTSKADNSYELWYFKRAAASTVQVYDFDKDGRPDLVLLGASIDQLGDARDYADIFVARGAPLGVKEKKPALPTEIELRQNYPNPFNPTTTISFGLPSRADVKLTVSNLLGQTMDIVLDRTLDAGEHQVYWDGSRYPSGVYYYRLQVEVVSISRKMILVK